MTSSHRGLYAQGYKRPTMAGTKGSETARRSKSQKAGPSSDRRLQFACVKLESLVIADQNAAVNMFPSLVHTARQATRVGGTRKRISNRKGESAQGETGEGD